MTLRDTLFAALQDRERMLSMGWSRRKDIDRLRAAMGRARAFLNSYPVADDERVRKWCLENHGDVSMIVPSNHPRALARLIMEALKPQPKIVHMKFPNPAA